MNVRTSARGSGTAGKGTSRRDLVVLGVVTVAVFAATLGFPFIWDDNVYVATNPHLRSARYLGEYFTASFCVGAAKFCPFYRPVVALSYLADHLVWGPNAVGFHLTNLALHVAVVLVFYRVTLRLFQRPRAARIAALFFALHPLRVESVAFVAARTDPPAALLVLVSWWAFARWLGAGGRAPGAYLASLATYGAALLTKEIALTLPVLLLLYDVLLVRPWRGVAELVGRWRAYVPYAVVAALYFVARRAALGFVTTGDLKAGEFLGRVVNAPALVWDYFRLELVPYPLVVLHCRPSLFGSEELAVVWGFAFLAAYLAFLFRARRWSAGIPLGGLWFVIVLLPVLNLVPIAWPTVVERFSYLPSLGLALAVGLLADRALETPLVARSAGLRRGLVAGGMATLALFAALTVARTRVWSDEALLWEDTVGKAPTIAMAQMNLGLAYQARGDFVRAAAAYHQSLEYNPRNSKIHHNLAMLYQVTGRPDEALAEYRKLIEQGEVAPQTYFNIGILYDDKDDAEQAITYYREAIRRNPDYGKAHLRLGALLADAGQPDEALTQFQHAIRIDPRRSDLYLLLASFLDDLDRRQEAEDFYAKALALAAPAARQSEEYTAAQTRLQQLRQQRGAEDR